MDKELIIETLFQQISKNWKEKVDTYNKVIEEIKQQSPVTYLDNNPDVIKDLFNECNALAFEKSLEMVISYCKVSDIGKKNMKLEMKFFIEKCFLSSKAQIRSYGTNIILIVSDKYSADVIQILLDNLSNNKRSVVNGILETITVMIKQVKKLPIKDIVKKIPSVIDARDKLTRDLSKILAIEICTCCGRDRIEPYLKDIKPVLLSELQSEFDKVIENVNISVLESDDCKQPVDLLLHLSADIYVNIDGSRQERKEVLEKLNEVIDNSPLINGNYRELIRKLCNIFTKDSQIVSVVLAGKLLTQIANGLKKNFSAYSLMVVESCFEKFKEKKPQVLSVTRECIDAAFMTTNLENCLEAILKSLENKNPTIRLETISFVLRNIENIQVMSSLKKNFKRLMPSLRKLCDDGDVKVREEVFQLIGKISVIVGEKQIKPFLEKLDSNKLQIINSIISKTVPIEKISNNNNDTISHHIDQPVRKKIISSDEEIVNPAKYNPVKKPIKPIKPSKEMLLSEQDLADSYIQYFGKEVTDKSVSQVWKLRLEACDKLIEFVKSNQIDRILCQIVVQFTFRKPGLKDSNVQVVKKKLKILNECFLKCENGLSMILVELCLNEIIERIGDAKLGFQVKETLSIIFLNTTPIEPILVNCVQYLANCKSAKSVSDGLGWFIRFLSDNKFKCVSVKEMLPAIQQILQSQNSSIKQQAVSLIGLLRIDYGEFVSKYFQSEKPNIVDMIDKEIMKREKSKKELINQNKITGQEKYEKQIDNIHSNGFTKQMNVVQLDTSASSVSQPIINLPIMESIAENQSGHINSFVDEDDSINRDSSYRDIRDDCRSFVLDLCEKLNFYTSSHPNSLFQEELGLFLSTMKSICDPEKKSAINILHHVLNNNWIESEVVSTQTESEVIPIESSEKIKSDIQVPERNNEHINIRRKARVRNNVYEDSEDLKENNYENQKYEKSPISDLAVLQERSNNSADKYLGLTRRIIFILENETSASKIYENLSRLKRLLKDESRAHILDLVPQLVQALLKRSKTCAASCTVASSIQELQQILISIMMIYSEQQFIDAISNPLLGKLYHQLFTILVQFISDSSPGGLSLKNVLSSVLLKMTTKTNRTESLCSMICLLSDSFNDPSIDNQYISVLIKNTAKIFELIKSSSDQDIDYSRVLLLISDPFERFFDDQDKANSISLKTIKTIIDFLTKIKKLELLNHVPENNTDNLISYIHKCYQRIAHK